MRAMSTTMTPNTSAAAPSKPLVAARRRSAPAAHRRGARRAAGSCVPRSIRAGTRHTRAQRPAPESAAEDTRRRARRLRRGKERGSRAAAARVCAPPLLQCAQPRRQARTRLIGFRLCDPGRHERHPHEEGDEHDCRCGGPRPGDGVRTAMRAMSPRAERSSRAARGGRVKMSTRCPFRRGDQGELVGREGMPRAASGRGDYAAGRAALGPLRRM
jgi:hypothetical protein